MTMLDPRLVNVAFLRVAALRATQRPRPDAPPRSVVWWLEDPAPVGLRPCDLVVGLPRKAASAEAWALACQALRLPLAEEVDLGDTP